MMEKLKPGLYANEDGSEVIGINGGTANRDPWHLTKMWIPMNSTPVFLRASEIRRRYPLRVVRCEVEK